MKVTAELVAEKITGYLQKQLSLSQLVDWSENMVMEADYDKKDFEAIREILACLGVSDVKEFGLTWDNCYDFLKRLHYRVEVKVSKAV